MQPLSWYARRLASMTPAEMAWRLRAALRDTTDRHRFTRGLYPGVTEAGVGGAEALPDFRLVDLEPGGWAGVGTERPEHAWLEALRARADAIAVHRFSFFDLEDRHLGDPVDWNRDHSSGRSAPLSFAPGIDYRDFRVTGDAKVVWEPNRHHQLVVLGRAYRATGDTRYAGAVVEQIDSWLRQCPFGVGMNWRSPLELAIRLINWTYAVDLIRDSGLLAGELRDRLLHAVYLHLWEITRKYSHASSANNHRIGEAAGVSVAASYFRTLSGAERWRAEAKRILCEEIETQTYADGCNREQALGYHWFVLQFFVVAGVVARRAGEDLSREYWAKLATMFDFACALGEGGESSPMFGDSDDGYVLDIGSGPADRRGWLAVGAALFGRSDFKQAAAGGAEGAFWLLGSAGWAQLEQVAEPREDEALASRSFPASGYHLLQCGTRGRDDRISVVFDCGELGFGSIAAHGHADALSFSVRAFGREVLVDPGTYDYFSFPAWREYFRSTRSHNALEIDGFDQSSMLGPFLWGQRARARCVVFRQGGPGVPALVIGEHDGYSRLSDPVVHRRALELNAESRTLTVRDDVIARGGHGVALYFHLAEDCQVTPEAENRFEIAVGGGRLRLRIDPRLTVQLLTASQDPIAGWVSRGYHRKAPGVTLVGRGRSAGIASYECRLEIGRVGVVPAPGGGSGGRPQ